MTKRLSYEYVKEYIENQGYQLLSNQYVSNKIKLILKCSKGHEYLVSFAEFKNLGSRCSKCNGNAKFTLEEVQENQKQYHLNVYIEEIYTKIIGDKKKNKVTFLSCKCLNEECNYKWEKSIANIQYGCPRCNGVASYTTNEAREEFTKRGYIPLFHEYKGANTKLLISTQEGYKIKTRLIDVKIGTIPDKFGVANPYTIENIRLWLKLNNNPYKLISNKFKSVGKNKLLWECSVHGEFSMSLDLIQRGCGCPKCAIERNSGESNVNWKGGISPFHTYLREKITQWKKDTIKVNECKCVLTRNKFNAIHHLYSFNNIVGETMKNVNLPIYGEINQYTKEELKIIEKECIDLHNKYGLGVCLCKELHDLYHSKYGRGNNTVEQFKEFISRLEQNEFRGSFKLDINYKLLDKILK